MSSFTNQTLMVTGGTGSFGNAILNRFLTTDIGEIRIFSRDEKKQDTIPGVDYVLHAAALKQVPSCEFFPM